jgi:hypothetical protein
MTTDFTTAYTAILKFDENEDGTLMVYGNATDDSLDLDQQICDPTWLEKAMPDWFTSGGNVREMHGPSAAGVAKEYENKNGKHIIGVHVVDPIAVKKVKNSVYRGFSVGIKSPRVVRDTKAVNGRIIDGAIIEVSLVDRPANPNAKLILAKSVDGESSLVRVEEIYEYKAPLPSQVFKNIKTEKGSKMETIKQITELAKSLTPDTAKFDQDTFDAARRAIAQLIIVEAGEMAESSDETYSLAQLVEVANHLMAWYQGEVHEGEATPIADIELAVDPEITKEPDTTAGCDCAGCKSCKGCDEKMCSSHIDAMKEKSANHKCLECGCTTYDDNHGRTDVTTAELIDLDKKSAEADDKFIQEVATLATTEISDVQSSEDEGLKSLVTEAVKSAMEKFEAEKATLVADRDSAVEKALSLETELATALEKTVAGGPKRTAIKLSQEIQNAHIVKALQLKAKADASTDPILAKGYLELAADEMNAVGISSKTL